MSSDESTSIARQREVVQRWADANGHNVIGWAEDVDVSGAVDAFDTPRFGAWLNTRAEEFDAIAAWKLDRLGRNAIQLSRLFGWCLEHDKTLVSCSESIDLSSWAGRMLASVIAGLAEGELESMRDRQRSSRQKLRETARWPGGRPPYGYRAVDNRAGPGKVLEIDPEAHKVVKRIVDAVIDGVPLARIARQLNVDGVRPPADHYRVSAGRMDTLSQWRTGPMRFLLSSPTLVGQAHLGGTAVRDDSGLPVMMAKPLVDDDERTLVLAELERRQGVPRERAEPAPLAGLVFCWFCETKLTMTTIKKGGVVYRYYRCPKACSSLIPAGDAETLMEETFIGEYGNDSVVERVWVPGDSHETELKQAIAALDELTAAAGVMTSNTAKDRLQRQLAAVDARIAQLESKPIREGGYEYRPTGETYLDAWNRAATPSERREMLQRADVTMKIGISGVGKRSPGNGGAWHFAINVPEQHPE